MRLFLIFLMGCLNLYSEKIELADGSIVNGEFVGYMDNYYVVKTEYGILNVEKDKIVKPQNIDLGEDKIFKNNIIEIKKSSDGYTRYIYNYGVIVATQRFSLDGKIIESHGNAKDGIYYEYDENENLKTERVLKNNMENGYLIEYYPEGGIKARMNFEDGKLSGPSFFYDKDGHIILEQNYRNGVLDGSVIEYGADGQIISKKVFSEGKEIKYGENESKNLDKGSETVTDKPHNSIKIEKIKKFTGKVIKLARGYKIFIYRDKKYLGSLTLDDNYNIVDITGDLPEDVFSVKYRNFKFEFRFSNNLPLSLEIYENDVFREKYSYDSKGIAVLEK